MAAHGVNRSWATHHSLTTVDWGDIGAVEGAFLSKSYAGVRHETPLIVDWSRAVHHPISAIHGGVLRAGGRGHGKGGGEQAQEQEVHHPASPQSS